MCFKADLPHSHEVKNVDGHWEGRHYKGGKNSTMTTNKIYILCHDFEI